MGGFIDFLVNNYLIFLLIALILIFALIGYLVDNKKKNITKLNRPVKEEEVKEEEVTEEVELEKTLKGLEGVSLGDAVKEVSPEVVKVENEEEVPSLSVDKEPATDLGKVPTIKQNEEEEVEYDNPIITEEVKEEPKGLDAN